MAQAILGDLDGDNKITKMDILLIQAHLLGKIVLNDKQKVLADINGDGEITILDLIELANHLKGRKIITEVLTINEN